jgi:TetR/AcrR family transcriptional regulator
MNQTKPIAAETLAPGAEAILKAAADLFAAKGFAGASINAIALGAGTSKANIFHHFGSKQGLYLAVLKSAVEETSGLLDDLADGRGPVGGRLERFSREHLFNMLNDAQSHRLVLREVLEHGDERGQTLAEEVVGEAFSRLVILVREGVDAGEFRPDLDPALAATLLVSANVFFFQAQSVLRHVPAVDFADRPERYSAGVIDILLNGMRVTNGAGGE